MNAELQHIIFFFFSKPVWRCPRKGAGPMGKISKKPPEKEER
jgi:hypothetical protein